MKFLSTIAMVALAGFVASTPTSENESAVLLARGKYRCFGPNVKVCNIDDTMTKCDANAKPTVYRCSGKCTPNCPVNEKCKDPTCHNPTRL